MGRIDGGEEIERRDALRATVSVETTLFVTSREREGKINREEGGGEKGNIDRDSGTRWGTD